jgi:4-hydroxy-tetrahydrodipicolinate synthase
MLPLNRLEFQPGIGVSIRKHVLVKHGVLKTAYVRHPGAEADQKTLEHIFRVVDHLKARGYNIFEE